MADREPTKNPGNENQADGKPSFSTLRFYGDEFVFDTMSGMFHRVSPAASFILHCLQAGTETDELAALLQTRFGVGRSRATRDVELFLGDLVVLEQINRTGQ